MAKEKAAVLGEKKKYALNKQTGMTAERASTMVSPPMKPKGELYDPQESGEFYSDEDWREEVGLNKPTGRARYKIKDVRSIDAITKTPIKDTGKLEYEIDMETAKGIIKAAKKKGVNPYTALAISYQETGIGGLRYPEGDDMTANPFRIMQDKTGPIDQSRPYEYAMDFILEKYRIARNLGKKTEAEQIQAFNGYGTVGSNTEGKQSKMYGIDVTKGPIDMNKRPVYGERIIDIRDNIIKKDPAMVKLVEETL